jgi:hypothetical protein
MWASLGRDIFSCIARFLPDGRTAALCARVCKTWAKHIGNDKRLSLLRRYHVIHVEHIDDLGAATAIQRGVGVPKTVSDVGAMFDSLLWVDHGISSTVAQDLYNRDKFNEHFCVRFYDVVDAAAYVDGAENGGWVDLNGNLCTVSNIHWDYHSFASERLASHYDIDAMERLRAFFDGCFTWRLIRYPPVSPRIYINKQGFNRGACVQLIFRSKGIIDQPSYELLKTVNNWTLPRSRLMVGRGEKRRKIMAIPLPATAFPRERQLVDFLEQAKTQKNAFKHR